MAVKANRRTHGHKLHPFAAMGVIGFAAIPGLAATFMLEPTADAFVTPGPYGSLGANNYGGAGALSVAAPGRSPGEFQSVLRFNLFSARSAFNSQFGAGQWIVQSFRLQLTAASPGTAIFNASHSGTFHISWMQSDSWAEGTGKPTAPSTSGITFNSLPGFLSAGDQDLGTFSFAGGTSGSATYTLALASGLTSELLAGNDADLRLFTADNNVSYLFHSRSYIRDSSSHPLLTISAVAVPEPGSAVLVAFGAALLAGMNLCRKARARP